MFQIVFNEISAAEISQLPTLEQLELLSEFKVSPQDVENPDGDKFGHIERVNDELGLAMPLLTTPLNYLSEDDSDGD